MAAERNLGQFFMLGDRWFFVHVLSPKFKKRAVPGGNVPPFDQIYHLFLDAFQTFPGLLSDVLEENVVTSATVDNIARTIGE